MALTQSGRAMRAKGPPACARAEMIPQRATIMMTPRVKPATGEVTMGRRTFHRRPSFLVQSPTVFDQINAPQLLSAAARAAPQSPPIKACDEEDGRPRHQVKRFQIVPPSSAHRITCSVTSTTPVSTSPEAMVLATAVPQNAPMRLVEAASMIAWPGDSTLVATTVAMELAVSWNPLMNSKASATNTTVKMRMSIGLPSAVLQRDLIDHRTGIPAPVNRLFKDLEEFFEQEHANGVEIAGIEFAI